MASFLQRLGRTGRRAGSVRNTPFLALDDVELIRAAGLLLLHSEGFVEPVTPPPQPRHVAAQQMLGTALQKGRVDLATESAWMSDLGIIDAAEADEVGEWLIESGHLDVDSGLAFIGPVAERRYGTRNFMDLLAIFTANPEVTVLHGRTEIGSVDPMVMTAKVDGPRIIALAGRPWVVTHIDWPRRRAYVEPSDQPGRSRWSGEPRPYSFELADAIRRVLLGEEPEGVEVSGRAAGRLDKLRATFSDRVRPDATVVAPENLRLRWWTFAGAKANAVLTAAIGAVAPELLDEWTYSNLTVSLRSDATRSRAHGSPSRGSDAFRRRPPWH